MAICASKLTATMQNSYLAHRGKARFAFVCETELPVDGDDGAHCRARAERHAQPLAPGRHEARPPGGAPVRGLPIAAAMRGAGSGRPARWSMPNVMQLVLVLCVSVGGQQPAGGACPVGHFAECVAARASSSSALTAPWSVQSPLAASVRRRLPFPPDSARRRRAGGECSDCHELCGRATSASANTVWQCRDLCDPGQECLLTGGCRNCTDGCARRRSPATT